MSHSHHVLIIGVGSIGERHLRCFQSTGRSEVSFVEINAALRTMISERYNVQGFAGIETAISELSSSGRPITSAVVATPANRHLEIATQLAEFGIHLLIEKPLSTTTDGYDQLVEITSQKNLVTGVAYVMRCFPALAAMRDALRSGRFGKPVEIVAACGQNFQTYRPAYRDTYYVSRETGGGAIQDALTHVLNAGEWLVGPIDRLVADAAHRVLEGVTVEDTAHVLTRQGYVLGSYSLNQHQAPNETSIAVICDGGTVRWESHTNRWRWMLRPEEAWRDESFEVQPRDAAFIAQANQFLDAVERKTLPLCSLEEGLQTLRVNLAALASADGGGWRQIRCVDV